MSIERPRTRAQRRAENQLNLNKNNDGNDNADDSGVDFGDVVDVLQQGVLLDDINKLNKKDRKRLDKFLSIEKQLLDRLRELQLGFHQANRMSVGRLEKWALEHYSKVVPIMDEDSRKGGKVTIILRELKAARAAVRAERAELITAYVDLGLEEDVLRGARIVLSGQNDADKLKGKKRSKNGKTGPKDPNYDPSTEPEESDSDIDKLENGNDGKGGASKARNPGNKRAPSANHGKRKKRDKINNENDENGNKNDDEEGDEKKFDADMNAAFAEAGLPPAFKRVLDGYFDKMFVRQEAARAAMNNGKGVPGGNPGDKVKGAPLNVPPFPEKELTAAQKTAKAKIGKLMKDRAPRARQVCN